MLEQIKGDGLRLAEKVQELWLTQAAIQSVHNNYYPDAVRNKDFKGDLETAVAAEVQRGRAPSVEELKEYKDLLQMLWTVEHPDGTPIPGAGGANDDDDIVDVGAATQVHGVKNRKCPLSMQDVWNLNEPVMDQVGYVYEKADLLRWLGGIRGGKLCPNAGTSHYVSKDKLKDAKHHVRLYRRTLPNQASQAAQDIRCL